MGQHNNLHVHRWIAVAIFTLAILTSCTTPQQQLTDTADTVFLNGKVLTVDQSFSIAEAVAVKGERIIAVGSNDAVRAKAGASTRVIDLNGKTVIPGLIDNHMHFIRAVQRWNLQARIDGINKRSEALAAIAAKAASLPAGDWLMVQGGWSAGQFADQPGGFTLEELDAASPNNPMFLQILYNSVYANSLALEAVGFSADKGAKYDGPPLVDAEPPYGLLNEQMPEVSEAQKEQNLLDFIATLNRAGLTSVYDVGRPPEGDISLLERMSVDGPLPLRVWHTLKYQAYDPAGADAAIELIKSTKANTTDDYLGMLGLGEHVYLPMFDLPTMKEPFSDTVVNDFMRIATAAAEEGYHMHEHTMLDMTVQGILPPLRELNERIPLAPLRWTLAHAWTVEEDSIVQAKELGLNIAIHSVSMHTPTFLQPDLRSIQDSGIVWGLGTDGTIVAHYQPFITLGWAVTGKSINGKTLIEDPVTREEALIAHTRSNAYLMFKEDDLGTLEVGKLADLVVLDKDYLSVPADEIFYIQPQLTMVGGRIVFEEL